MFPRGFLLLAVLAYTLWTNKAGVVPEDSSRTTNIRGPRTQTKIMGPDGSVIESESPGGEIVQQHNPGMFEPAGRFLGPTSPLFNPAVPGQIAHRSIGAALLGSNAPLAMGTSMTQAAQDSGQSVLDGIRQTN